MYTPKYSMTFNVLIFTKLLLAKLYHIEISYTEFHSNRRELQKSGQEITYSQTMTIFF